MLRLVLGPVVLFAIGFLPGLLMSSRTSPWRSRALVFAVLFSPIAALIVLRYFEAVDEETVSVLFLLPRAIKLPLLGLLVGYGLHTLLTVGQATGRH